MTVLQFPNRKPSVTYETIKRFDATLDCQQIALCHGVSHEEGREDTYAVIFMAPPGSVDGYATVAEFRFTEEGRKAAELVAECADRTLTFTHMLQPDPEMGWSSREIEEMVTEARATFGDLAATQLQEKLTGGAA